MHSHLFLGPEEPRLRAGGWDVALQEQHLLAPRLVPDQQVELVQRQVFPLAVHVHHGADGGVLWNVRLLVLVGIVHRYVAALHGEVDQQSAADAKKDAGLYADDAGVGDMVVVLVQVDAPDAVVRMVHAFVRLTGAEYYRDWNADGTSADKNAGKQDS